MDIYSKKSKSVNLFFGAAAFVACGLWLFINADDLALKRGYPPYIFQGLGLLTALFFGIALCIAIYQLFRKQKFLRIHEEGIRLYGWKSKTEIPWSCILGFQESQVRKVKMIIVEVQNPEEKIAQETSPVKKQLMQLNYHKYGSPFIITETNLSMEHQELLKLLQDSWGTYH